ncbi:hypothetical protein RUM44_004586 [Polyplax serrata]|uniref:Uncharacterized protein n=1 Tax=Polyplax serrata TaxID=468196 RepID=A0ABR1B392_POLSC
MENSKRKLMSDFLEKTRGYTVQFLREEDKNSRLLGPAYGRRVIFMGPSRRHDLLLWLEQNQKFAFDSMQ